MDRLSREWAACTRSGAVLVPPFAHSTACHNLQQPARLPCQSTGSSPRAGAAAPCPIRPGPAPPAAPMRQRAPTPDPAPNLAATGQQPARDPGAEATLAAPGHHQAVRGALRPAD
eukprot:scaffold56413_cov62-Phaeocystis_antarctica.AAC.7